MKDRIGVILFFITLMLVMSVVCSCRAPQTVTRIERDSVYIDRLKRDSIYQRDSIYIIVKGDTVFKYQYKYSYRDKLVRDTVAVVRRDSIPYPVEVSKYVERKLSWWQTTLLWSGVLAWLLIILILWRNGYITKLLSIIKKLL
jgi:hypothetical protein